MIFTLSHRSNRLLWSILKREIKRPARRNCLSDERQLSVLANRIELKHRALGPDRATDLGHPRLQPHRGDVLVVSPGCTKAAETGAARIAK
jgi:hypothetical protein